MRSQGEAYLVYSSDQGSGGKTKRPVIERLAPSWTGTSGEAPSGEKDAMLAQKLGQLQPLTAVFLPECMGQLASSGPT